MSDYKVEVRGLCKKFCPFEVLKIATSTSTGESSSCGGTHRLRKDHLLNTLTCLIPPTSGEIFD